MVIGNSEGEGVLKGKILKAKYEAKLEFLGGGVCTKKPSMREVWIFYFSGTTQCGGKFLLYGYNAT